MVAHQRSGDERKVPESLPLSARGSSHHAHKFSKLGAARGAADRPAG